MVEETAQVYLSAEARFDEVINQLKQLVKELKTATGNANLFEKVIGKFDTVLNAAAGSAYSDNIAFKNLNDSVNKLSQGVSNLNNNFAKFAQTSKNAFKSTTNTKKNIEDMAKGVRDMAAQANRFNTGNIAAQAQDIIVTAQMNMRPITIGLQQGTQLLYVLQQSKAPLKEFVAGVKSLFNPLSLVVVGLTTVVAALIQWVNWGKLGKTIAEGLAKSFEVTGLIEISKWFESLADSSDKAWDSIKKLLDLTQNFSDEMNDLANKRFILETELYNPNKLSKEDLKEEIYSMEKYYELSKKLEDEKRKFINENFEKKDYNELLGNYMKEYNESKKAIEGQARDYAKLRIENDNLQEKINERNKKEKEALALTKKQVEEFDKLTDSYDKLFKKQSEKIENEQFEQSLESLSTYEKTYRTVVHNMTKDVEDLKAEAIAAGVPISKINQMFADSPSKIEEMARATAEWKEESEEISNFNDLMKTAQSETAGFFKDMRQGLRDGQSMWEAFGNAVNKVLDKILDKMIDIGVEAAFTGLGGTSSNKGILGSLVSAGASLFGGITGGTQVYNSPIGPTMPGATPLTGAADGGVFSNGVYSSPTLFKFAKGGKFGVMGEAGPEAVMPLHRSPDGSLGISADGVGGGSPVVVNVINNSNAQARTEQRQTSQGVEIDVMIDEMVAEKLGRNGTASNNALRAYNNRQLVMR